MSKVISLTIPERLIAIGLFNESKGSVSELSLIMDTVKAISFTEQEKTDLGLVIGQTEIKWDPEKVDATKDIEFSDEAVKYLSDKFKEKTDFSIQQYEIVHTLQEKLTA